MCLPVYEGAYFRASPDRMLKENIYLDADRIDDPVYCTSWKVDVLKSVDSLIQHRYGLGTLSLAQAREAVFDVVECII